MTLTLNFVKNKSCWMFKKEWLEEIVETEIPWCAEAQKLKIGDVYTFRDTGHVVCNICSEADAMTVFSTGKKWNEWKLDYLKRHLKHKVHLESINAIRAKLKEEDELRNIDIKEESLGVNEDYSDNKPAEDDFLAQATKKRRKSSQHISRDEYDIFGEYIACKIRKLNSARTRSTLQRLISEFVCKAEIESLCDRSSNENLLFNDLNQEMVIIKKEAVV